MSRNKNRICVNFGTPLPLSMKPTGQFMAEIQRLSRHNRQCTNFQPPLLFGRHIDLQKLYNEVASRGGHKQVTYYRQWSEVYSALHLPAGCVDAGHGLRTIYQRYLDQFERNQRMISKSAFMSDDLESSFQFDADSQETEQICKTKIIPTPVSSEAVEDLPNHLRESWNLSIDLVDRMEYTNLERCLQSALPNEIELALNTILLMSYQPRDISLYKNPKLLDLILSTVGICDSGRTIHLCPDDQLRYSKFWDTNVKQSARHFLSPDVLETCLMFPNPNTEDMYSCSPGCSDIVYGDNEGSRIHLVIIVLRNLVIDNELSALVIGRHPQALRFIFLCIYTKHSSIHQLGLETLASLHFPVLGPLIPILQRLLADLLVSVDRIDRIRSLQIIRNLCTSSISGTVYNRSLSSYSRTSTSATDLSLSMTDRNATFLASLPSSAFNIIIETLCLRDLHLAVLAVEVVYSLTCLGPSLCDRLLELNQSSDDTVLFVPHCQGDANNGTSTLLSLLVGLLNLEAQAMGSESLVRIKVMQAPGMGVNTTKPPVLSSNTTRIQTPTQPLLSVTTMSSASPIQKSLPPLVSTLPETMTRQHLINQSQLAIGSGTAGAVPLQPPIQSQVPTIPQTGLQQLKTENPLIIPSTISTRESMVKSPTPSSIKYPIVNASQTQSTHQSVPVTSGQSLIRNLHSTSNSLILDRTPVSLPQINKITPIVNHNQPVPNKLTTHSECLNQDSTVQNIWAKKMLKNDFAPNHISNGVGQATTNLKSGLSSHLLVKQNAVEAKTNLPDRRDYMFEWLRSNYAVHDHSSIPRVQIYSEYQKAHQQKFGNTMAVSPVEFHSQIKSIFPGVGQVKVQVPGGSVEIHYNNLKHVNAPEPETKQGVNHIMASVLSPNKIDSNSDLRNIKSKSRKRPTTNSFRNSISPKPIARQDTVVIPAPKISRQDFSVEANRVTNGQSTQQLNGLSRDVVNRVNSRGEILQKESTRTSDLNNVPRSTKFELCLPPSSYPESRIVLLPVFTAFTVNHGTNVQENGKPVDNSSPNPGTKGSAEKQSFSGVSIPNGEIVQQIQNSADCSTLKSTAPLQVSSQSSRTVDAHTKNAFSDCAEPPCSDPLPKVSSHLSHKYTDSLPCKWDSCGQSLTYIHEFWNHFESAHHKSWENNSQIKCLWDGCLDVISSSEQSICEHLESKHHIKSNVVVSKVTCGVSSSSLESPESCGTGLLLTSQPQSTPEICVDVSPNLSATLSLFDDSSQSITLSDECKRALAGGPPNPSFLPPSVHEGPVTKHLRLTAALSLRNLLQYSDFARRYLSTCEGLLCDLAFSGLESSPTIYECLTLLSGRACRDTCTTSDPSQDGEQMLYTCISSNNDL